ncbi:MAG TPA: NAD-dependent deacylase [Burkholderiaceae bacterium]|nr:NAD-dependent deacylase [Burkholderiaceae bacterium]
MDQEQLDAARAAIAAAKRCVVLTGAGMSAESGVPTFRDAQTGLWSRFDPMRLASVEGFCADPALVWRWYAERREGLKRAAPHAGHRALPVLAQRFERFTLVTQNVDGLHVRAGSRNVLELHGNILRSRCFEDCGVSFDDPAELPPGEPPACPQCGAWLRPDVVWFGELLDPAVLQAAEEAAEACDLMLVVGTSGMVYPAAGLPEIARRRGAKVIVINPNPSDLDDIAHIVIPATAGTALPALL